MRRIVLPLALAMITACLLHATAQAAPPSKSPPPPTPPPATPQMRTYVSGLGSDANPCLASWPCQTFQAALALTTAGGEIYVLDSANYGAVTINKAVSITSEGAMAGVLATSGAGITIAAGGGDVINLRGLDIDGGGFGGIGIQFSSGQSLNIQKSAVRNFTNSGISFSPNGAGNLFITDTMVTNNGNNGISVTSNGTTVSGAINRVTVSGNGTGILAYGGNASVTIIDTVAGNNSYGIGASASGVMVRNSTVSNNGIGIAATNGGQVVSYDDEQRHRDYDQCRCERIINLQGLDIDGAGSGASGIQFNTGGSLNVQNSVIRGFSNGINF
jgi:hypothetical protein